MTSTFGAGGDPFWLATTGEASEIIEVCRPGTERRGVETIMQDSALAPPMSLPGNVLEECGPPYLPGCMKIIA